MKNLILTVMFAMLSLGFGVAEVEAKRLGGGSSFGMKRQATARRAGNTRAKSPGVSY